MNPAQALHTAARRYCQKQLHYWYQKADELRQCQPQDRGATYRQQLLGSYGRAEVLMIICSELERLNFDGLEDVEDTCDRILQAGRDAKRTKPRLNMGQTHRMEFIDVQVSPETEVAIAQERDVFCAYIQGLSAYQLQSVQPLPYQRVLSPAESEAMWSRLRQRWHIIGHHWYPLSQCSLPDIVAFQTDAFEEFCTSINPVDLLSARGIHRIWELREYGIEYEQDVCLFEPAYTGAEGYWSSDTLDWIVYASHEASVTVGGWLLEELKGRWPDWKIHTW